ncbi:MAG TPA: UvrB/UvrC motif-containing protein [Alkalispirochaeta sp.]|nr:UvrB/UvrC motif-containing protein [Alkalispirochaeta sp.]
MGDDTRTVRVVRVIGGTRKEVEIPSSRARELGIGTGPDNRLTVAYLMDGLMAWQEAEPTAVTQCPQCGTTHRELILRHTAGCAQCYEVFSAAVHRVLAGRNEAPVHRGRIPQRLQRYRRLFVEREDLISRLNGAVETEDFEAAAQLRDRLRTISDEDAVDTEVDTNAE